MKTENKIVKYLIENKEKAIISKLASELDADYKIVHTATKRLIDRRILESVIVGKSILVWLSGKLDKEVINAEFERREDVLKNKNLALLLETIKNNLKTVNFTLILFGSYAKNKARSKSDIDLIFIVGENEEKFEREVKKSISILPLDVHMFVFSEKQFIDMKNSKELNVVKEAIRNNIILHGIEMYYELIKK